MQFKDATRFFGRVGILAPLILIFLTAADSALACPGHNTKVAYRTRVTSNRTLIQPTVIAYRAPASYSRCGSSLYDTRGAKYVAMRGSGTRYVAVRSDDGYSKLRRVRYTAVRNVDIDDAPRYVAVRNRYPVHRISDTRYAEVRSGYRSGNGVVAYIDTDAPRYVAVRRTQAVRYVSVPSTRYVAVRNMDIDDDDDVRYVAVRRAAPRTRYVAVRNVDSGCTRAVALRSCLGDVETTSVKHVVLRDDDTDSTYSKLVAVRDDDDDDVILENDSDDVAVVTDDRDDDTVVIDDDSDNVKYVAVASDTPKYVEYRDANFSNAAYETPVAVSTRRITYVASGDDDVDDQAYLDEDGATYVAAGEVGNACLSSNTVGMSYVPIQYADRAAFVDGGSTYISTENASPTSNYVPVATNGGHVTYVAADNLRTARVNFVPTERVDTDYVAYVPVKHMEEVDSDNISVVPVEEVGEVDSDNVSVIPVENVEEVDTDEVSVVPVEHVEGVHTENASFVPVADSTVSTVSYLPVASDDDVETTFIAEDACPMAVSNNEVDAVYVANIEKVDVDDELVAELNGTQRIAGRFGYRDGFEDGREAALEGDVFHPENSGDYQKATEGYEDDFGDKDVYKDSYRTSYLAGYRAGFDSADGSA